MDDAARNEVAEFLDRLAEQTVWNPELWQKCYALVGANTANELLGYVYDDLIHYSGLFHAHNIFGFRVKPDRRQLEDHRREFRAIAAALRSNLSLSEAITTYGL